MNQRDKALYIYKASAGSGKTFTLAVEYITLLITNPHAYRKTLAVTFTNKATAEMKERILSQLYGIAHSLPSSQGYYEKVKESYPSMDEETLRSRARTALHHILHDYGHFRIQTIDAFFQSILRGLAKELELSNDIEITIDSSELLNNTVDLLIKRLTPDSSEMAWIVEYIEEHLENDKSWKVRDAIKKFAENIIKEEYQQRGGDLRQQIEESRGTLLTDYRNTLQKIIKDITERAKALGDRFFRIADSNALCVDDFAGKSRGGIWGFFEKLQAGEIPEIKSTIQKCIDDPAKISKKASNEVCDEIHGMLQESSRMYEKDLSMLNSCNLSMARFHQLRLLNSIAATLKEENNRENRFLLAQTTHLLSCMIDNDTSFIFEKIGTEIRYIFIDEFQDTSRLQWFCFKVLLHEVMSRSTYNLIVGDVKQSIYRWRNSDWNILNNIENEFPKGMIGYYSTGDSHGNRTTNFRSKRNVVEFNNALFKSAAETISIAYEEQLGDRLRDLTKAYSDVEQLIPKNKEQSGYAEVRFVNKGDAKLEEKIIEELHKTLHTLLCEKGVKPSDITILVRGNKEAAPIIEMFNREFPQYGITSEAAYRLSASTALQILTGALRQILLPDDRVNSALLAMLYRREALGEEFSLSQIVSHKNINSFLPQEFIDEMPKLAEFPIYELIERIIRLFSLGTIEGQEAYLYSFLDYASEYINSSACDLKSFVEAWDNEICDKTIPIASDNSIKVITIHKSKGLEFHTVIIPFCTWSFTGLANEIIWCEPQVEPFSMLSLLPINRSNKMLNSIYHEEYNHELLFQLVDNLNVLYVACTRASANLIMFSDAKSNSNTAGAVLRAAMSNLPLEGMESDIENGIYRYGEVASSEEEKVESNKEEEGKENPFIAESEKIRQPFVTHDNRLTSRQSHNLARFLAQGSDNEEQMEYMAIGNLMHELMSKLSTGKELPQQLARMQIEGVIGSEREKERIRKLIEKALENPYAKEWFTGKYRLFNEHTILCVEDGEMKNQRPDRVMVSDDEAIVVDFKFGTPYPEHQLQVKRYMKLMSQMGYGNVKGYLWYIYKNRIEQVRL